MLRFLLVAVLAVVSALTVPKVAGGEQENSRPQSVVVETELGNLSIRLDWANAPENCAAFVRYARKGIYAHTSFDSMDEFCLYGGKPFNPPWYVAASGNMPCDSGPPGEFKLPNRKWAVGFRRTAGSCNPAKRSNCTQIYIMLMDHPEADGEFTIFGAMEESGQPVMDAIKAKLLEHKPVPFKIEAHEK